MLKSEKNNIITIHLSKLLFYGEQNNLIF